MAMRLLDRCHRRTAGARPQPSAHTTCGGRFSGVLVYLIEEVQTAAGPDMEFCQHTIDADQIPPEWQQAAVRITRESLANACRHSKRNGYSWSWPWMATCSVFTSGIGEPASNLTKQCPDASDWGGLADHSSCQEAQRRSTANRGKGRMSPSSFRSCSKERQIAIAKSRRARGCGLA